MIQHDYRSLSTPGVSHCLINNVTGLGSLPHPKCYREAVRP